MWQVQWWVLRHVQQQVLRQILVHSQRRGQSAQGVCVVGVVFWGMVRRRRVPVLPPLGILQMLRLRLRPDSDLH
jgi:hypothetical protein